MAASLFIGLGGSGLKILSALKVQMEKEGISNPIDVAYLGIDIGGQDIPHNLNQNEIIIINEGDVRNIINSDFYWNYIEQWWFDRSYAPAFKYQQGAWQLRLLGRLALFYKGSDIIDRISRIFQTLQGNGVEIFVISSSSGGTGAGMFRDMPALLRQTPNLPANHNIFGFLMNYDIVKKFNTRDSTSAVRSENNAVSLLSEMDIITLKSPDLVFHIYNPTNSNQSYVLNLSDNYRWVFIQSLSNEKGSKLDKVEDYYELAALVLKNAYFISNSVVSVGNWSGIENSIGAMLNNLIEPIKTTLTLRSGRIINYQLPLNLVNQYVGFGGFVIEFPEDEIREYLKVKILNEVYNELENSNVSRGEKDKILAPVLSVIQESNNQDKLLLMIDNEVTKSAKELRKYLLSGNSNNLVTTIANELYNSQNISSSINLLKSDVNAVLSNAALTIPNIFTQLYDNVKNRIVNDLINNSDYNLKQKLILLDELISAIKYELEDYSNTEKKWAEKINESVASNALNSEINNYNNYINSITTFQKIFKSGDIETTKNAYLNNIANIFANTYFRTMKLQISNGYIVSLYSNLINYLNIERQKIESDLSSFAYFIRSSSNYFPNDLQSVISSPNEADFHIKVAKVKSIVDKYIYEPNTGVLFNNIRVGGNINFSDIDSLKTIVEDNSRRVLQNFTLDKGLELEADYFINHLPIIIDSDTRGITEFKNLIEFAQQSSQAEKKLFYGRYSEFFDINSLTNLLQSLSIDVNLINSCIDELISGRLTLIYNRWNSSFAGLIGVPGVNQPPRYIAYKINSVNNPKTYGYFNRNISGNHTIIENNSTTRLDFVNFSIGFSLAQLEPFFNGLRDRENNRVQTNISYFKNRIFSNPDSNNIYHNDKRFVENIELMNYSPLIVPIKDVKIKNCWKLIILLLALDFIDTDNKKFKRTLLDFDNLRVFDTGFDFISFDELFKVLYLFNEQDINNLVNQLESEIRTNPDRTNLLNSAINYFIDNNLFDPLIPFVIEYVETFT